jgi:phosphomevalonate kinase
MTPIRASAPGKLFLLGEYAVLEGAPALLSAVDRRVTVEVSRTERGWRLNAPGTSITGLLLDEDGALPARLDAEARADARVFDAVRRTVTATRGPALPGGLAVTSDSRALRRTDRDAKLGLGSSAAAAVALTAALMAAGGEGGEPARGPGHPSTPDRFSIFELAATAHRAAQGGNGSGADVAASVFGGLLGYTRGARPVPLVWPDELTAMAIVTGEGASTTELVGRVRAFADGDERQYRSDLSRLVELADRAQAALGSVEGFLRLASDYFDALAELDEHARAGIVSARHHELHALAALHGGVFKTSGAGGGDVGLAFSPSGTAASRLRSALREAGADVVPLAFGAEGVRFDPEHDAVQNGAIP